MALRPRLIRENSPGEQLFLCGGIPFSVRLTTIGFIYDKLLGNLVSGRAVKLYFSQFYRRNRNSLLNEELSIDRRCYYRFFC